MFKGVKLLKKV